MLKIVVVLSLGIAASCVSVKKDFRKAANGNKSNIETLGLGEKGDNMSPNIKDVTYYSYVPLNERRIDLGLQIQNISDEEARVNITFYAQNGFRVLERDGIIPPRVSINMYPLGKVPPGFTGDKVDEVDGMAVISSNKPLAVIINFLKWKNGTPQSLAVANAPDTKSNFLALPIIPIRKGTDEITIMNPNDSDARVTVVAHGGGGKEHTRLIRAHGWAVVQAREIMHYTRVRVGVTIESDQPVAALYSYDSNEENHEEEDTRILIAAVPKENLSNRLVMPLFQYNNGPNREWKSEIYIFNTENREINVKLSFSPNTVSEENCQINPVNFTIPNFGQKFYIDNGSCKYVGSAFIEAPAGAMLAARVKQFDGEFKQSSYNAGPRESIFGNRISLPLINTGNSGWWTGVTIVNGGNEAKDYVLKFSSTSDCYLENRVGTVPANGSVNELLPDPKCKYVDPAEVSVRDYEEGELAVIVNQLEDQGIDNFDTYLGIKNQGQKNQSSVPTRSFCGDKVYSTSRMNRIILRLAGYSSIEVQQYLRDAGFFDLPYFLDDQNITWPRPEATLPDEFQYLRFSGIHGFVDDRTIDEHKVFPNAALDKQGLIKLAVYSYLQKNPGEWINSDKNAYDFVAKFSLEKSLEMYSRFFRDSESVRPDILPFLIYYSINRYSDRDDLTNVDFEPNKVLNKREVVELLRRLFYPNPSDIPVINTEPFYADMHGIAGEIEYAMVNYLGHSGIDLGFENCAFNDAENMYPSSTIWSVLLPDRSKDLDLVNDDRCECGADVTKQLSQIRDDFSAKFDGLSAEMKRDLCGTEGIYNGNGWDIRDFYLPRKKDVGFIENSYCGKPQTLCHGTVSVNRAGKTGCYRAETVNYFLWGLANYKCSSSRDVRGMWTWTFNNKATASAAVAYHRGKKFFSDNPQNNMGDIVGRMAWFDVGWEAAKDAESWSLPDDRIALRLNQCSMTEKDMLFPLKWIAYPLRSE